MFHRISHLLLLSVFLVGCFASLSSLESASLKYKHDKNYTSLQIIYEHISKGMQRKEVERLLGRPDYSPVNGQYYYSSTQSIYAEDQDRDVVAGLVVDYRDKNGTVTEMLQEFWLGSIGE